MDRLAASIRRVTALLVAWVVPILLALFAVPAVGAEPAIPGLDQWQMQMYTYGQALCDYLAQPLTLDELLPATQYDAERVFYQIAAYTGDRKWITCADRAEAVYRDRYVQPQAGAVPGYWNSPRGLALDYLYTKDTVSRDAAIQLAENAMFARDSTPLVWTVSADYSHEVAWAILSYLDEEALGVPRRARLRPLVDQALGHIDQWFVSRTAVIKPYRVGLTAEALIAYYERTQDARIPPAIKGALDWLWEYAWLPEAEAFWYSSSQPTTPAPDLNLLIAPAYAWLYRQTGGPSDRERGDAVFAGGVKIASLGPKQITQNYRWSFDYVKWRIAGPDAPTELAGWEANMRTYGQQVCDDLVKPWSLDDLLEAVYYDGERVFYQIADYTGDASWETCAQRAEAIYRDRYVVPDGGVVPGFWNFTRGLAMAYLRTGDLLSRQAAILLSENAAFARDDTPLEWTVSEQRSREVAYAILSYLDAESVGAPRRTRLEPLVDQALGHIDQWFVSRSAPVITPFMVGLTSEALIRCYEQTQDSRIPPAIQVAMDWLWANAWMPLQESFWYNSSDTTVAAPDLNLLIAPAYAWLYHQTGDLAYLDRGDQLFAGGVKYGFLANGKQFNQTYRWSVDYVTWRHRSR